jgi:HEAT repeat-containing protein 5
LKIVLISISSPHTEFASQLPHDGGAFYTNDTINSSKPHYLASWPPILLAAALWLRSEGYDLSDDDDPDDNDRMSTKKIDHDTANTISHGSVRADRFHLIFGICMEALCSTRTNEKLESIITCLQALYTTFDSKWARATLMENRSLPIELCNVLHRLILTRDSLEVQLLCMEILKQTIRAANEHLDARKAKSAAGRQSPVDSPGESKEVGGEEKENNVRYSKEQEAGDDSAVPVEIECLGEGGDTGAIEPGNSFVYAVLEVVLCLLVRQIPSMNPSQSTRIMTEQQLQKQLRQATSGVSKLDEDNGMLVCSAIQCLDLTSLCSPKGAVAILPTVLYMTTGIIKEVSTKSVNDHTSIIANTGAIQATLHLLKALAQNKLTKDERVQDEWLKLLQSALHKIIDLTKTGCDETKLDEATVMLAIAVFILHSPGHLVAVPELQFPAINHFRQCMQSESRPVRLKCVQTMRSIFVNADLKVATPYIHALAPRLIENLHSDNVKLVTNDTELALVLESITTVEALIGLAEPQNSKLGFGGGVSQI